MRTPSRRKKGSRRGASRAARLRYTVFASPLGRVLVAVSQRGVCALRLGRGATPGALATAFPGLRCAKRPDSLAALRRSILRYLAGAAPLARCPLETRGTAFQRRVWAALARIPPGETRSYGEIARAIGRPGAARAVGRACAANPVALFVPCHRAVRASGAPGGYAWGAARKRRLLALEAKRRGR